MKTIEELFLISTHNNSDLIENEYVNEFFLLIKEQLINNIVDFSEFFLFEKTKKNFFFLTSISQLDKYILPQNITKGKKHSHIKKNSPSNYLSNYSNAKHELDNTINSLNYFFFNTFENTQIKEIDFSSNDIFKNYFNSLEEDDIFIMTNIDKSNKYNEKKFFYLKNIYNSIKNINTNNKKKKKKKILKIPSFFFFSTNNKNTTSVHYSTQFSVCWLYSDKTNLSC